MNKMLWAAVLLAFSTALLAQSVPYGSQIQGVSGNGRSLVTTTGAQTNGDCVKIDANGNHVPAGAACATGGGGVSTFPSTLFSVSGTTASYATGQTANRVFATDNSGNVGSFALTTAMLPSGVLLAANNLSDVTAATARTNLGLATVASSGSASDLGSGTLPSARIVALPNANLANSSLTIAGHSVSLGGTQALALSDLTGSITATQLPATYSPDVPPTSAGAIDDEFNGSSLTGWTQVNQGTSATTEANGVLSIIPQISNGAHRLYAITKSEPVAGGPWTITAKVDVQEIVSVNAYVGLCVYDGTKLVTLGVVDGSGTITFNWAHWTNFTTNTGTNVMTLGSNWASGWVWLQINNDGTNLNLSVSADGRLFNQIHTEAKASFLANTGSVGLFSNVTATGGTWTIAADYIRSTP